MKLFGISAELVKSFLVSLCLCLFLMAVDYQVDLSEATVPIEKGLLQVQVRMNRVISLINTPIIWIQYSQNGVRRMADLEQRLNDTVVDRARLEQLEAKLLLLEEAKGLNLISKERGKMVPVIADDKVLLIGYVGDDQEGKRAVVTDHMGRLLGIVNKENSYISLVTRIDEFDEKTAVEILGKGERAILVGRGNGAELEELLQQSTIALGDIVVTSGEDDKYPPGIVVGQVTEIEPVSSAVTRKARVELSAQPEKMVVVYE
jgi:rod shape-determining protein MreC